jgi:hypothetical protein
VSGFERRQAIFNEPHVDCLTKTADCAGELVAFLDTQFAGRNGLQDGAESPFGICSREQCEDDHGPAGRSGRDGRRPICVSSVFGLRRAAHSSDR